MVDQMNCLMPLEFRFEFGWSLGESVCAEWIDGDLTICRYTVVFVPEVNSRVVVSVTPGDIQDFWSVVDRLGVWHWENEYYCGFFDGYHWSLSITREGKVLRSKGSNSHPPAFHEFLDAMSRLVPQIDFAEFAAGIDYTHK